MADFGKGRFSLDNGPGMGNFFHQLLDPVQLFRGFYEDIALQFVGDDDRGDLDVGCLGLYRLEDIVGNGPLLL